MYKIAKITSAFICLIATSTAVWAESPPPMSDACKLNETATISLNFNGYEKDAAAVKSKLDTRLEEIKTLAKEAAITKFQIQSNNYSINYNEGNGSEEPYQYSGSFGFIVQPADQAVAFMVTLGKKGYHPSVNVSSYRNGGNCQE